jgi:hypothetical protein
MFNTRIWVATGILTPIIMFAVGILGGLGCMGFYNGVSTSFIARTLCTPLKYSSLFPWPLTFLSIWLVLGIIFNSVYWIKNKNNAPLQ